MIGLLSLIPISIVIMQYFRIRKLNEALEIQASKRNGVLKKRWFYPMMVFNYYSHEIKIYSVTGSKNSPPYTHVLVKGLPKNKNTIYSYKASLA